MPELRTRGTESIAETMEDRTNKATKAPAPVRIKVGVTSMFNWKMDSNEELIQDTKGIQEHQKMHILTQSLYLKSQLSWRMTTDIESRD